jgi:IS605 OrfB family transposase
MSIITIQCRLVAPEETLRHLWELMALKNTPLVNELLSAIAQHPDLETWLQQGKLPAQLIKTLCNSLKTDSRFAGQPGRFYSSAISLVDYIYKSWFAIQKRKRLSLKGKKRWLDILKSDLELEQECNCSLAEIRSQAQQALKTLENTQKLPQNKATTTSLFDALFIAYDRAKTTLECCAIAYLLKNNCSVSEEPENPEAYEKRRRAKEIEIQRLEQQLQMALPKGRDLSGERWLNALDRASSLILTPEELASVQANLLKSKRNLPFSVLLGANTDLRWFKNEKGRICVKLSGLDKYPLEVQCDRRQLHWFERFVADCERYRSAYGEFPGGLFALRSAVLVWKQGKGNSWNINSLALHCSVDTLLWTAEGTERIRTQKIIQTQKTIQKYQENNELSVNQERRLRIKQTSLNSLQNFHGLSHPGKPLDRGNSALVLGVSIGLEQPATLAVVNIENSQVLAYRTTRQLLGKKIAKDKEDTQYKLLKIWHLQQQENKNKRHQAQLNNRSNHHGESDLGLYINRLLAKAIVETAREYHASTIVLPDLKNKREILESEMYAIAELKFPGQKIVQKRYVKSYRTKIHTWNYQQLTDCIKSKSAQENINIEIEKQYLSSSHQERAKQLAFSVRSRSALAKPRSKSEP